MLAAIAAAKEEAEAAAKPTASSKGETADKLRLELMNLLNSVYTEPGPTSQRLKEEAHDKLMDLVDGQAREVEAASRHKLRQKDNWWKLKLETQRTASKASLKNQEHAMQASFETKLRERVKELVDNGDSALTDALAENERLQNELQVMNDKHSTLDETMKWVKKEAKETERKLTALDKESKRNLAESDKLRKETADCRELLALALSDLDIKTFENMTLEEQLKKLVGHAHSTKDTVVKMSRERAETLKAGNAVDERLQRLEKAKADAEEAKDAAEIKLSQLESATAAQLQAEKDKVLTLGKQLADMERIGKDKETAWKITEQNLRSEIESLQGDDGGAGGRQTPANQKVEAAQQAAKDAAGRADRLQNELNEIMARAEAMQLEIDESKAKLNKLLTDLNEKVVGKTSANKSLGDQIQELIDSCDFLKRERDAMRSEAEKMRGLSASMAREVSAKEEACRALQEELDAAVRDAANRNMNVTRVAALEKELQESKGKAERLRREIVDCKNTLRKALEDLDIKISQNKTLAEQIRELIQTCETTKAEAATLKDQVEEVTALAARLEYQLGQKETERAKLRDELKMKYKEISDQRLEMEKLKVEASDNAIRAEKIPRLEDEVHQLKEKARVHKQKDNERIALHTAMKRCQAELHNALSSIEHHVAKNMSLEEMITALIDKFKRGEDAMQHMHVAMDKATDAMEQAHTGLHHSKMERGQIIASAVRSLQSLRQHLMSAAGGEYGMQQHRNSSPRVQRQQQQQQQHGQAFDSRPSMQVNRIQTSLSLPNLIHASAAMGGGIVAVCSTKSPKFSCYPADAYTVPDAVPSILSPSSFGRGFVRGFEHEPRLPAVLNVDAATGGVAVGSPTPDPASPPTRQVRTRAVLLICMLKV